jgi:very-short-patch-repair endonuclease
VLRHVADGYRSGSAQNAVNEPEADALMAQLIACIRDPRYAAKTMGVISLQGEAQAKLIEHKILEEIDPEIIEERRLVCGDAYAFQGDERHIIFLSMVAAPNERIGALTVESARQRFNVAVSRAQDQLWLFHSATLDVLSPACMRHRLLSYMLNPRRQETTEASQKFESQFERDVFRSIVDGGFHVRTQVAVGDPTSHRYRIDLVVEGMQGRLAVECDGDQWHGADRYEQDLARQRDLERAGWQFVRIRGGDFYRDRAKALEPLWLELERIGIRPGGIDETAAEPPSPVNDSDRRTGYPDEANEVSAIVETDEEIEDDRPIASGFSFSERNAEFRPKRTAQPQKSSEVEAGHSTYQEYLGTAGDDPRTVNIGVVADALYRIIEVEGPIVAKRAYDIYLRGCGIKRLGGELKSTMNKALAMTIRQNRVISEDELDKGGFLYSVVRAKGTPAVKIRDRGPRTFDEIPPSELQAVARIIAADQDLQVGSDGHLRAILESYDLRRLTTQVGTTILEILDRRYPYVDELLKDSQATRYPPRLL